MLSVIETINTTVNNFIWGVPAYDLYYRSRPLSQHPYRISSDQEIPLRYENNPWPHAPKT